MPTQPSPRGTPSITLPPIATPIRAVSMRYRDDRVVFRIDKKDNVIHALPIDCWDPISQSSELSATDRGGSTAPAYERTAVGIGVDCFHDAHRNAPRLCYCWRIIELAWSRPPSGARNAVSITGTGGTGNFLHGRHLFLGGAPVPRAWARSPARSVKTAALVLALVGLHRFIPPAGPAPIFIQLELEPKRWRELVHPWTRLLAFSRVFRSARSVSVVQRCLARLRRAISPEIGSVVGLSGCYERGWDTADAHLL